MEQDNGKYSNETREWYRKSWCNIHDSPVKDCFYEHYPEAKAKKIDEIIKNTQEEYRDVLDKLAEM